MFCFRRSRRRVRPATKLGPRRLHFEALESRNLLATLVSPSVVSYQDADGDQVQVRLTQPLLTAANVNQVFQFSAENVNGSNAARQALDTLDLTSLAEQPGLSISVDVTRRSRLGDGVANVGLIDATGKSLGAVRISGDLGAIAAGDFDRSPQTFTSLWNDNLRRFDDNRDGQIDIGQNPDTREVLTDAELNTFGRMDDDFNAKVNFTEFRGFVMRGVDLNSNGSISSAEISNFIQQQPNDSSVIIPRRGIDLLSVRSLGDTSKLPRSITAAVDEVFRRYDVNANGQINLTDPAEVANDPQLINTFSQMDANRDSRIIRTELSAYFSRAVDENWDNTLSTLELAKYAASEPITNGHLFGNPINRNSQILGNAGTLDIRQNLISTQLLIDGTLANATIGGSLLNVGEHTAELAATFNLQRIVIGGSVEGRVTANRDLVWAQVNGSILGGAVDNSGNLGAGRDLLYARVNGDVVGQDSAGLSGVASGVVFANRNIGVASIGGSLQGGSGDFSGAILAEGRIQTALIGRDLVGGATAAPFSLSPGERAGARGFGFVTHHTGLIRGRELVNVTIGRDIRAAANGLTGVQAVETIGTLTIGRDVIGQFDNHVAITAGGQPLTLTRAAEDILKRYDKNKNGFIDVAQNIAKREITTPEQIATFSAPDGNFDAKVSLNELREWVASSVDADSNGILNADELNLFQSQDPTSFSVLFGNLGPSTPLADIAALILRRYDANRDNRIDLRQNIARREVTTPEQLNTFSAMDADFNAFVSQTELLNYLSGTVDADFDGFMIPAEADAFQGPDPTAHSVLFPDAGIDLVGTSGLTDVAIGRLIVVRDLIRTDILAGYDVNLAGIDGDAQIGVIIVGRDWIGSSAVAGVQFTSGPAPSAAAAAPFAALSDLPPLPVIGPNLPGILSRIDTITIGRKLLDDPSPDAGLNVIAAEEVRRVLLGGPFTTRSSGPFRPLWDDPSPALNAIAAMGLQRGLGGVQLVGLLPGPFNDDLFLTPSGKTRLRESPRQAFAAAP